MKAVNPEQMAIGLGARPGFDFDETPMLCGRGEPSLCAPGWAYELKLDGARVCLKKKGEAVSLRSRRGVGYEGAFPELVEAMRALPADVVLDGEIVAFGATGMPSFETLQRRLGLTAPRDVAAAMRMTKAACVVFDVLRVETLDVRPLPLRDRRTILCSMVPENARGVVQTMPWVEEDARALAQLCDEKKLEGIVAKRLDSPYVSGRSPAWLKYKTKREEDFVVVGFTRGEGARGALGALDLASYEEGVLRVRGKVGSGLSEATLRELRSHLGPLVQASPSCEGEFEPAPRGRSFVKPECVVRVSFQQWTEDGRLRHPVFVSIRHDLPPEEATAAPQ